MKNAILILFAFLFSITLGFGQYETKIKKIKGAPYPGSLIEKSQTGFKFVTPDKVVKSYAVGDTIKNGIVFWIDPDYSPDGGLTSRHGLICAFPEQIDTVVWSTTTTTLPHTSTKLYGGFGNTIYTAAAEPDAVAPGYCLTFGDTVGGYFLPNESEFQLLVDAWNDDGFSFGPSLDSLAFGWPQGFTDNVRKYWTSQEIGAGTAGVFRVGWNDPGNSGSGNYVEMMGGFDQNQPQRIWPFRKF